MTSLVLGCAQMDGVPPTSTWTGLDSSSMNDGINWTDGVPDSRIAIFNGDGDNSPISNRMTGLVLSEMQFNSPTLVSVITSLETNGISGVISNPGVTTTFDIYEHNHFSFPPASFTVSNGPAGAGGGVINYNLQTYGQLYAFAGSSDSTVVNVTLTGGNNYFEVTGPGSSVFDNVTSDDGSDEIWIDAGADLTIRGTSTQTIEAVISGDGSLTKTGAGVLILNSNNLYTGDTVVQEGVLVVNADLASNVTVDTNGTLKGSGSIAGDVSLSGTVAPGNSIGTLNLVNLNATSSSVFEFEVSSSGSSDKIIASGSMTLGGTLEIIPLDLGFSGPETFSILESTGPISGVFGNVIGSVPAFKILSYQTNGVSLTYLPIASIGLSHNAEKAADCYTSLSGPDADAINAELIGFSFAEMETAFNQMQPSQYSAMTWAQLDTMSLVRSSYTKHLKDFSLRKNCLDEYRSDFWVDGFGQWERQGSAHHQFGYHDWTTGVTLGSDTTYRKFHFGGAASYSYTNLHWDESAGDAHVNSYYGGFYGGWSDGIGYVTFSSLGGYSQYKSSRQISFGTVDRTATASHHGWDMLTGIEGGAYFKAKNFRVGPFGRLDYVYLWQNNYREKGAESLNLCLESRQDQLIQTQVGVVFTTAHNCIAKPTSGTLTPRLELSYINQSPIARSDYEASFDDCSCEFKVHGWNFERNLGAVEFGLTYLSASQKVGFSVQYDGQFGHKYISQSGQLIFNVKY